MCDARNQSDTGRDLMELAAEATRRTRDAAASSYVRQADRFFAKATKSCTLCGECTRFEHQYLDGGDGQ
jgi:hypothetical protein